MSAFAQEYSAGLTWSVVGHGLVLLAFVSLNLVDLNFDQAALVQIPIEATVVDMSVIREQREAEARRQQELERQRQAAEAERREQEQRRQAEEQQRIAEQKRKEEAERKRVAEEKRQADEAERQRIADEKRKAEEARIAAQKRREEAARQAEARRRAEAERQRQALIAEEDARLAAISSGKLNQYVAAIAQRVERNWAKPASAGAGIECEVDVSQIPGGEIVSVRVGRCNGDAAVVRSIEAAVYRSSPLPPPPDPSLFERNLSFIFKPEE